MKANFLSLSLSLSLGLIHAQPANDLPCDAIALPTNGDCVAGTTIGAGSEGYTVPADCLDASQHTVWYTLTLANSDNRSFELSLDVAPGIAVALILYTTSNCDVQGSTAFYYCGDVPGNPIQIGPVSPGIVYYVLVSTQGPAGADFTICAEEIGPCYDNDVCATATLISGISSDESFVCIPGCNLYANPEALANPCGIQTFSTVWFTFRTDLFASVLNIQVTSQDFIAPTISAYLWQGACNSLVPIPLTTSLLPCIVGSGGEASALGTPIGSNLVYYIAISSLNSGGGEFTLCINTISEAAACVIHSNIQITSRTHDEEPLTGPFFPGETVGVCMNVLAYSSHGNNCQWFQGLVPVFGNGWDPESFDAAGQPLNATLNGIPFSPASDGLYGAAVWGWFADIGYHHPSPFFQVADLDGNGTLDMCSTAYDPDCPDLGGLTGSGGVGPCWNPLGHILPPGWFAWGINGLCPIPGHPGVDYGDGGCCSCTMGPWNFCFDLKVRDYPDCEQDPGSNELSLGFFTFADGETGSWNGGPSLCALDKPVSLDLPLCCVHPDSIDLPIMPPVCNTGYFVFRPERKGVEYWRWTVEADGVEGTRSGEGPSGVVVSDYLEHSGTGIELATYYFEGYAGAGCLLCRNKVMVPVVADPKGLAVFEYEPKGLDVHFNSTYSSGLELLWYFGDGTTASGPNPVHTFPDYGEYTVRLIVTVPCGSDTSEIEIILQALPPVAQFSLPQGPYCVGDTLVFNSTSLFSPEAYEWVFEGGIVLSADEQAGVVVYDAPGTYDVMLVVSNIAGSDTLFLHGAVTILAPPAAEYAVVTNALSIELTYTGPPATAVTWNIGDGVTISGPVVQHTFDLAGWYEVTLTVENECGLSVETFVVEVMTTSVTDHSGKNRFVVYPNPAKDVLYISFAGEAMRVDNVKLFNVYGQQLFMGAWPSGQKEMALRLPENIRGHKLLFVLIETGELPVLAKIVVE